MGRGKAKDPETVRGAHAWVLVPSGRMFASGDGIVAKLGLGLPLEAAVGRVEDLWRVSGRAPPPRKRRVWGARIAHS